jgi:UDP-N-acetylmuramate dehydrogenase
MTSDGITVREEGDAVYMTADAGVSWDALVWSAAEHGAWGIENLAGIPGTVGAAPVQNIGAYGAELKNVYAHARVLDSSTGVISDVSRSDTAFSYRDSRFKHEPNLIILAVTLVLSRKGAPHIGYADLEAARASGTDLSTPRTIGEAVRSIRSHKFPDIREYGTAGSFFKNPILTPTQFAELSERYGAIPSFPSEHGIKVPLAFILDRVLNLRGYRKGNVWLFGNQPLVLVADRTARAHEVEDLAQEIEQRVFNETNIKIEREVRLLEAHEAK